MTRVTPPRFTRTPHLVGLIAEAERLSALLTAAPADAVDAVRDELAAAAAVASLRLDGSRITAPPDPSALDIGNEGDQPDGAGAYDAPARGSWFEALDTPSTRLDDDAPDEHVWGLEYLGVRAAMASDDLAGGLQTDLGGTLPELHRRLTRGLLNRDRAGTPRLTEQAVHDASVGRIIYFTADPAEIPARIAMLAGWLDSVAAREHAVIVSGVLQQELLAIHPYEAANGRLARAAARLLLRGRGLDPGGASPFEVVLEHDRLGYWDEVARTARRRDLTIWLERWGEGVAGGLRATARRLGLLESAGERGVAFVAAWPQPGFTVADYRAEAGVGPEDARADLQDLLDGGAIERVLGSRGLRFTITEVSD